MLWMILAATLGFARCDTNELQKGVHALANMDREHHQMIAAMILVEGCKVPTGTKNALTELANVPPDYRAILDQKMAVDAIASWVAACPGGPAALIGASELAPSEKRPHLWEACELSRLNVFTEVEWNASAGLTVAPIIFGHWLSTIKVKPVQTRAIARALAGISDRPEDNQVSEFKPLIAY